MAIVFNETFRALASEAQFTREMLGSGATQIWKAQYANKGIYFQAFTNLSTGLERIGKLCLLLDHYVETGGEFPDLRYMKKVIGHNIRLLYIKARTIIKARPIRLNYLEDLDGEIHQNILTVLSGFAEGDRYSNINVLTGSNSQNDPISSWYEQVDQVIFQNCIPDEQKSKIASNARMVNQMIGSVSTVLYGAETGGDITGVEDASYKTGVWKAVAPFRQFYILQIIRFWVELLRDLQYKAMAVGKEEIPFLSESFALFHNADSYFKTRKRWD